MTAGKPLKGVLTLALPEGLHGYQNPPSGEFEIPVKLSVADPAYRLTKVDYPGGESMTVAGGDQPTRVYQGTVRIPFTLLVAKALPKGASGVSLRLDYQLCTMQSCYPPAFLTVKAPLKVVAKARA